ncbi:MAG TPA: hypothetical protein ENI11_00555 [Actinobacteria bacterium]|nr:hypothetical protein [Actinomycetota bacterium]
MKVAAVDFKKCAGAHCSKCLAAKGCDRRVIKKFDWDEPAVIDASLCDGCGVCPKNCEHSAIKMIDI